MDDQKEAVPFTSGPHLTQQDVDDMAESVRMWKEFQRREDVRPGSSYSIEALEKSEDLAMAVAARLTAPEPQAPAVEGMPPICGSHEQDEIELAAFRQWYGKSDSPHDEDKFRQGWLARAALSLPKPAPAPTVPERREVPDLDGPYWVRMKKSDEGWRISHMMNWAKVNPSRQRHYRENFEWVGPIPEPAPAQVPRPEGGSWDHLLPRDPKEKP